MLRLLTWPLRAAIRALVVAACAVAAFLAGAALPAESTAAVRGHVFAQAAASLRWIADSLDPPVAQRSGPAPDRPAHGLR
jgi:hypothetical protein